MKTFESAKVGLARWSLSAAAAAVALAAAPVQAQESNFSVLVGAKVWVAEWVSWFNEVDADGVDLIRQDTAKAEAIVIPLINVRYKDFFASFSGGLKSDHEFVRPVENATFSRNEQDFNVGYYILPGLAATIGLKRFDQKSGGTSIFKVQGPTVGLSATANLSGPLSAYGSFGYGALEAKAGNSDYSALYTLSEVGLAYSIATGTFLRSVTITAGYRTQNIRSKDLLLTDPASGRSVRQDGRDVTDGFALGMVLSF